MNTSAHDPNPNILYRSRDSQVVIYCFPQADGTFDVRIDHDLKKSAVPRYRVRAINTLQTRLADREAAIAAASDYAPGARTLVLIEHDRDTVRTALAHIRVLWPPDQFGAADITETQLVERTTIE